MHAGRFLWLSKRVGEVVRQSTESAVLSPTDELVAEKEKYKALAEELEQTFAELTGN